MEARARFKILSGLSDDALVKVIWEQAKGVVLELTNRQKYIDILDSVTVDLAIIMSNRLGTEGEASRSEGGISVTYTELPYPVQQRIERHRLARVAGHVFEKKEPEEGLSSKAPDIKE